MKNYKNKRFIASAVCPQCKQMDKLMTYDFEGTNHLECVNCHYKINQNESLPKPKEHTVKLPTRKKAQHD